MATTSTKHHLQTPHSTSLPARQQNFTSCGKQALWQQSALRTAHIALLKLLFCGVKRLVLESKMWRFATR